MFELLEFYKNDNIIGIKFLRSCKELLIKSDRLFFCDEYCLSKRKIQKWDIGKTYKVSDGKYKSINKCINYV